MFDSRRLLFAFGLVAVVLVWSRKADRCGRRSVSCLRLPGSAVRDKPILKPPATCGQLKLTIRDAATRRANLLPRQRRRIGRKLLLPQARITSRGSLSRGSGPGKPPNTALGNRARQGADPLSGPFLLLVGPEQVDVPPGPVRVEVWKGLEYRPRVVTTQIAKDETRNVEIDARSRSVDRPSGVFLGGFPPPLPAAG